MFKDGGAAFLNDQFEHFEFLLFFLTRFVVVFRSRVAVCACFPTAHRFVVFQFRSRVDCRTCLLPNVCAERTWMISRKQKRLELVQIVFAFLFCHALPLTSSFFLRNLAHPSRIRDTSLTHKASSIRLCSQKISPRLLNSFHSYLPSVLPRVSKLKLNEKSNGFRDEGSDTSDERSADLAKEFQRLENGRGVVGKALRKGLTRQLKSMTPAKNLQKALRKRLQTQRGTSTLFLVEFTE
jgi:hypothetical protein